MIIVLFRGRPGTGKTTLSTAYATQTNHPVLSKDSLYDGIVGFIPDHSQRNKVVHACLYGILAHNRQGPGTFILDFPFQTTEDFRLLRTWCAQQGVTLYSVLVRCSEEATWAERFNARAANPLPNQLITSFDVLRNHYGTMTLQPEAGELCVDSIEPIPELLKQVSTFVEKAPPTLVPA